MTSTTKRLEKKASRQHRGNSDPREGSDPAVDAVFNAYPKPIKARLLALRRLIASTAARPPKGVGALQETLKWGQPSYPDGGDRERQHDPDRPGEIRPPTSTRSISIARPIWSRLFASSTRRNSLWRQPRDSCSNATDDVAGAALRHCVALALTYHLQQAKAGAREIARSSSRRPAPRPPVARHAGACSSADDPSASAAGRG